MFCFDRWYQYSAVPLLIDKETKCHTAVLQEICTRAQVTRFVGIVKSFVASVFIKVCTRSAFSTVLRQQAQCSQSCVRDADGLKGWCATWRRDASKPGVYRFSTQQDNQRQKVHTCSETTFAFVWNVSGYNALLSFFLLGNSTQCQLKHLCVYFYENCDKYRKTPGSNVKSLVLLCMEEHLHLY